MKPVIICQLKYLDLLIIKMTRIFYLILSLALFASLTNSMTLFNLVHLNKTNGAMCMDGSQYGIYTFLPEDADNPPNKLLIYFEQIWEGWCAKDTLNDTVSRCEKYANDTDLIDYASSDNWGGSFMTLTGILSSNTVFGNWPKAMIKSCDGGSYFSDSSVVIKNKTLNFRGSKNVIQGINYLIKNNMLTNREQVVIVGVGNGGLGALAWADYIKANTKGKVKLMIDAAVWQNELFQKTQTPVFENRMKTMDKFFLNGKSFPNSKCEAANKNSVYNCFYASQLAKYVDPTTPIIFLQSYYDSWSAQQILGLNCTEQFGSLSQCTTEHRQVIQDYHKKITTSLQSLTSLANVGAFGIACVGHFFTNGKWDNTDFSVPMNSNNTAQFVIQKWVKSNETLRYLDTVSWPDNKVCSHQVKHFNLLADQ